MSESQSSTPLVVHGSRALQLPKPSRLYERNRSCIHPGCETRLSAYNAYDTCFNHTHPWSKKTASARRQVKPKPAPAPAATEAPAPEEFPRDTRIAS
jgi:hypothetical protein